jgi:hypothetical protein
MYVWIINDIILGKPSYAWTDLCCMDNNQSKHSEFCTTEQALRLSLLEEPMWDPW